MVGHLLSQIAFLFLAVGGLAKPAEAVSVTNRRMSVVYRVDRTSVERCFQILLEKVDTNDNPYRMTCSVRLKGPFKHGAFQRYTHVDTLEDEVRSERGGYYILATLWADLQKFEIALDLRREAFGEDWPERGRISKRHVLLLREKMLSKVGLPLRIDYIER